MKNLVSHDQGRTWRLILQTLSGDLGYHVRFRVMNARFWVPQNRARVFIVGFREETGFDFDTMTVSSPLSSLTLQDILHPEDGSEEAEAPYTEGKKAHVSERYTLSDTLWMFFQKHRERHQQKGNGFGFCLCSHEGIAPTLPAHYAQGGSEILIPQTGKNPRRLTPRECSRLMGFDHPTRKRGASLVMLWWFRRWNHEQDIWRRGFMCRLQILSLMGIKHLKNKKYPCCFQDIPISYRSIIHKS